MSNIIGVPVIINGIVERKDWMERDYIIANSKTICKDNSHLTIRVIGIEEPQHEIRDFDVFYCPTCNCSWIEP